MAEVNETIVSLEQVKDIYQIEPELCNILINRYDIIADKFLNLPKLG